MKKIKAHQIKPGMLINTGPKKYIHNYLSLITAVSGVKNIEYTFFDYQDSYHGQFIGSIDRNKFVWLIEDKEIRKNVLKSINDDLHRNFHDTKRNIDLIKLIQEMENK